MKKSVLLVSAISLLAGAIYVGSPYYAAHALKDAALDGDTDKLESSVDFPAVRESLKSQLAAAMMTKMQNDPEMQNNPFAGLGAVMMPAIVDRMIESYVTPEGVAAMIKGHKPTEKNNLELNPDLETTTEYVDLNRFRVRLHDKRLHQDGPSFLLERRGFATWKLIKLEIPTHALEPGRVDTASSETASAASITSSPTYGVLDDAGKLNQGTQGPAANESQPVSNTDQGSKSLSSESKLPLKRNWTPAQHKLIAVWETEMTNCDPMEQSEAVDAACARLDVVVKKMRSIGVCTEAVPDSDAVALKHCR